MKLIDFYKKYIGIYTDIIPQEIKNAHKYLENSDTAIYQFMLRHASVSINDMSTSEWTEVLQSVIASNSYKYDKLWETTQLEYDPLYNYDKTSTITTQYGHSVVTNVIADRITTNEVGEVSTTSTNGGNTNTTLNSETAIDTTDFKAVDKIETINGSVTNSIITPTHTDTHIEDGYTDTYTTSKDNDIVTEVTKGNIGVVSAIDLIKQQRELVQFSFINVFMTDILAVISNGFFE